MTFISANMLVIFQLTFSKIILVSYFNYSPKPIEYTLFFSFVMIGPIMNISKLIKVRGIRYRYCNNDKRI